MIRAIICDDETATQKIISYYIRSEGLPIEIVGTASNGVSSLQLIINEQPDLIFLDIQMPGMNGFEVIEHLREYSSKIIIITGYGTFSYAQKALRMGVNDILSKPIDLEQLYQAITKSIGYCFTSNDSLNRALLYIHQNYSEKITLEDLAREACCTTSHLAHLFKQHLQTTALAYIHAIKIKKAILMLQRGNSVQEVSYAVGYASLNNFYKYFKEYTGKTPAAYRNKSDKSLGADSHFPKISNS